MRPPARELLCLLLLGTTVARADDPFSFADFSWLPANAGPTERVLQAGPITGEIRLDTAFHYSFHAPADDTLSGSNQVFRHGELEVSDAGFGGDLAYKKISARIMTQFGLYSQGMPRSDGSPARGQYDLASAYRYLSEAYAGYDFGVVNVQAGLFTSYVGLWSYYASDNWTYQPSYLAASTPWFLNGVRAQFFVSDRLKIEPWIVNGWQSYGRFNGAPGVGGQVLWRPTGSLAFAFNVYAGADTLGIPGRKRLHSDNSVMLKWSDAGPLWTRAAASLTVDAGCEWGGGVECGSQSLLGFMAYQRFWNGPFGLTVGGGAISNPGRYTVLLPPINGATAATGTPYFTENPGDSFRAFDVQVSADYSPEAALTFRLEFNHRAANVPYFAGAGGMTPPGGNQGTPGSVVPGWAPDLAKSEDRVTAALLLKL